MASPPDRQPLTAELNRANAKLGQGERYLAEAKADPDSNPSGWARAFEAERQRARARLADLPPDERRRVERMDCRAGDAYLRVRARYGRTSHGPQPVRRRGSKRGGSGSHTSSADPGGDGESDPPGHVGLPPARGQTAGRAA